MAPHIGFDVVFLPVERRLGKLMKLRVYLGHAFTMMRMLSANKPDVVWVQLPQVPLMWVALAYRALIRRDAVVVADCHNAMFRAPWSKVPFGISLLSRCDVVLAHNDDVKQTAAELGVAPSRLMVVEDPPASFEETGRFVGVSEMPRPWFVFPASFAQDEPITELLEAARLVPEVSVLITGNTRNCRQPGLIDSAPENVRFLGYLSGDDFDALMVDCDAVIAFTRFDGIQLSVCGEAVGAGRPMLVSGTDTLKRLFPAGTVFVDSNDADDIARGFRVLASGKTKLAEDMVEFRERVTTEWNEQRSRPLIQRIAVIAGNGDA